MIKTALIIIVTFFVSSYSTFFHDLSDRVLTKPVSKELMERRELLKGYFLVNDGVNIFWVKKDNSLWNELDSIVMQPDINPDDIIDIICHIYSNPTKEIDNSSLNNLILNYFSVFIKKIPQKESIVKFEPNKDIDIKEHFRYVTIKMPDGRIYDPILMAEIILNHNRLKDKDLIPHRNYLNFIKAKIARGY